MADTKTTHLNLIKQDPDTLPDYAKDQENLDTLDTEIWARAKTFNGEAVGEDGGFHIDNVPTADNLRSSLGQYSKGEFIIRTADGSASIPDEGNAWLMLIRGNYVKTGYSPRVVEMTVTEVGGDGHISATIDEDVYESKMSQDGTTTFTYTSAWNANPATYGITVTGTPVSGDFIQVVYAKEVPGTIEQSYPKKFISTGWNLYDHSTQKAHLIRYSSQYAFRISGAYTSLQFRDSATGAVTPISPTSGAFDIPSGSNEGYLEVDGGNNTNTAVWMAWGDWSSAYPGTFETYTESVIDMTAYMAQKFPNGLLAAGTVMDEINLNAGYAFKRIDKVDNDSAGVNLEAAKASGRQYDYDENWVYVEREYEDVLDLTYTVDEEPYTLDGKYTANDHGLEMFTNTTVAVITQNLYGQNLKNKLERDVVTKSEDLIDNLTTNDATKALSAKQGKLLKDSVTALQTLSVTTPTVADNTHVSDRGSTIIKYGKMVIVTIQCDVSASVQPSTVLYTIPSGYRPKATAGSVMGVGTTGSSVVTRGGSSFFRIDTSGNMQCRWSDNYSGWFSALFVYEAA